MRRILCLVTILAVLGTAGIANAQVNTTGSIQGRVVDADGLPLPGVAVTVEGTAMMGEQTVFTGSAGAFRLTLLPRGTAYTVTFALQGFATIVRTDVEVGVRRTTAISIEMNLSALDETITVTGKSPIVDIRSTQRTSTYTDDLRNALPESRGVGGDLMNLAPEATPSGSSTSASGANFFGDNSTAYMIDGVVVSDPSGGSQFPFYSPDMFDVVELTSIGGSADQGKYQGVAFNVVTKSGGNEFHGEGNFFYQNNAFIKDNTSGINADLCPGDDPPCFEPPTIDYRYDATFGIGGPVIRDKMWFFASYQAFYESDTRAGVSYPVSENSDRFLGKFTFQLNADNRFITSILTDTYTLLGRPSSRNRTLDQTGIEPSMNITPNITWNSVLSPNAFLEVKYSGFYGYFDLVPFVDLPQSIEDTTGLITGGLDGHFGADRSRTNFQGSLSYFAEDWGGDHAFKFGAEYERNSLVNSFAYNASLLPNTLVGSDFGAGETFAAGSLGMSYVTYLGDPYLAYMYNPTSSQSTSIIQPFTLYAQDDWTVGNRMTMNLGIRMDRWGTGFAGGRTADNLPTLTDIAPRLGLNFDLMGDGRTSVNAFWGRFYEEFHGTTMNDFDPIRSPFYCLEYIGGVWEVWCRSDPKQDLGIDPNLTNQYANQFNVGIDHQLTEDIAISGRYIGKRNRNIIGGEDVGRLYSPVFVTTELGDELQLWNADDGDRFRVLTNNPSSIYVGDSFREYNGFQFKLVKRMADNWSLIASLLVQEASGNNFSDTGSLGARDDPNDFTGYPGLSANSRRYVSKIQGTYDFTAPVDFQLGFIINLLSGGRWEPFERFSSWHLPDGTTGGFNQGSQTRPVTQRGSMTKDSQFKLDLRLDKRFPLHGPWGDLGLVFDIFNVFNSDTVVNLRNRIDRDNFLEPTSILQPRILRLGLRWQF